MTTRVAAATLVLAAALAPAMVRAQCSAPSGEPARVDAVIEDEDIRLADGRTLKLAFVEVPQGFEGAARARVRALAGQDVTVLPTGAAPDRWGRILAQVFPTKEAGESGPRGLSLSALLIRAGLARMKPEAMATENLDCRKALGQLEAAARRERVGLWADVRYAVADAGDTERLLARVGKSTVFEGRVVSVGERRERTFLNFGRRWSEDTTVAVPRRIWSGMSEAGLTARALTGKRVRVRGIVESRDGPYIEITAPDQVELVEAER